MEFPADWVQHFGVHLHTGYPPELGARFRVHERLRPQPRFSEIVEQAIASDPDFRVRNVGDMARIVTVEGEYGAWVELEGQRQSGEARRFVGAVFLDEFASMLDVVAVIPRHFGAVRQHSLDVLRGARFGLETRPRRFFYVPPAGWQPIPAGPIANWYPPDFPNNLTNLVVPPAQRVGDAATAALVDAAHAELGSGLALDDTARERIVSSAQVEGALLRVQGKRAHRPDPIVRELAIFVVAPYAYRMRLETTNAARVDELREILRGVAGSFKPLPTSEEARLGRAFASTLSLFEHWAS